MSGATFIESPPGRRAELVELTRQLIFTVAREQVGNHQLLEDKQLSDKATGWLYRLRIAACDHRCTTEQFTQLKERAYSELSGDEVDELAWRIQQHVDIRDVFPRHERVPSRAVAPVLEGLFEKRGASS